VCAYDGCVGDAMKKRYLKWKSYVDWNDCMTPRMNTRKSIPSESISSESISSESISSKSIPQLSRFPDENKIALIFVPCIILLVLLIRFFNKRHLRSFSLLGFGYNSQTKIASKDIQYQLLTTQK
jgi:hypothetical protein